MALHRKLARNEAPPVTVVPVFDFDGLLCDGSVECLLVSFCAWHRLEVEAFSSSTLRSMPDAFKRGFSRCRGYARHIGHFITAFSAEIADVTTQREFDALYQRWSFDVIDEFVKRVIAFRDQVREKLPERWFWAQPLFPGVQALLRSFERDFYIVSAKDAASVLCVLERHGVRIGAERVFGECRSKLRALGECARESGAAAELLVFDDNVFNVFEARDAGYRALWATWGYHGSDHREWARCHGLPPLSLHEFTTRTWDAR